MLSEDMLKAEPELGRSTRTDGASKRNFFARRNRNASVRVIEMLRFGRLHLYFSSSFPAMKTAILSQRAEKLLRFRSVPPRKAILVQMILRIFIVF
uniref:Uncharacterized protein n=1 Tax=Romanomermis culicivorax TaxID=13658 RepID=A0A915KPI1_ROMCU